MQTAVCSNAVVIIKENEHSPVSLMGASSYKDTAWGNLLQIEGEGRTFQHQSHQ